MKKIIVFIIILFGSLQNFAQGCSTCRAQIESAEGSDLSVGNGLNTGIYILMGVPYVILFFLFRKQIIGFIKDLKTLP
ncbi:MAG: hypothetical protein N4A35_00840 [Flavobacteriales bacterium]|jgi:hypothetical protein|nr:hypothetical protein [Flavobacteriales bacterium]